MPSFNKVELIGRLVKDPELRTTPAGLAQCNFTIAVDRPYKNPQTGERKTDFFRCKAWKAKAEFISNYLGKGRLVIVEGRIELNEGTNQQGEKTYYTDIIVNSIESLDSPKDGAASPSGERASRSARQSESPSAADFEDSDPFADS